MKNFLAFLFCILAVIQCINLAAIVGVFDTIIFALCVVYLWNYLLCHIEIKSDKTQQTENETNFSEETQQHGN